MSSSGHVALLAWVLGRPYGRLDPATRKSFEVALHAGAALGLAVALARFAPPPVSPRDVGRIALSAAPAGALGLALERPIERRLGSWRTIATAQLVGGAALLGADLRPADRPLHDATPADGLVIGLAQVAGLVPGASRTGAAMTGARLRRLDRRASAVLAREGGFPLIAAATALKGLRLARGGLPRGLGLSFAVGGLCALASTSASGGLAQTLDRSSSLAPLAAYRIALGAVALARARGRRRIRFNGRNG